MVGDLFRDRLRDRALQPFLAGHPGLADAPDAAWDDHPEDGAVTDEDAGSESDVSHETESDAETEAAHEESLAHGHS